MEGRLRVRGGRGGVPPLDVDVLAAPAGRLAAAAAHLRGGAGGDRGDRGAGREAAAGVGLHGAR